MRSQSKPLVTCITPTLNSEEFLETFLRELSSQTIFPNFEVILNLSAPSERELSIAKKYKEKYGELLVIVSHEEIIPLGVAWNECISMAKADFIAIWNVDDLRSPGSLEAQISSFESSGAVVSYGPYLVVNEFESRSGREILEQNLSQFHFLRGMHFGPFMAFRKSTLQHSGLFDEQLYSGGDFDLAIRLSLQGEAVRTDSFLGYYLDAGRGASTSPTSKQVVERTVIELRYGIYDKVDFSYINRALDYDVKNLIFGGQKIPVQSIPGVSQIFANYANVSVKRKYNLAHLLKFLKEIFRKIT